MEIHAFLKNDQIYLKYSTIHSDNIWMKILRIKVWIGLSMKIFYMFPLFFSWLECSLWNLPCTFSFSFNIILIYVSLNIYHSHRSIILSYGTFLRFFWQDCFPARFGAVHFVNQPWYIEAMFKLLKPFLKEKSRDRVCINITSYVLKEFWIMIIRKDPVF